ncbi:MAG: sulfatase [Planctomycetota bacterium]
MRRGSRAIALLAAALISSAAASDPPRRPNVLFIAVDDLRPDLGCYGVAHARTPHLDAFAATAMTFEEHYVQAPSCGASRAALLTGRSPARSGRLGNTALYEGKDPLSPEPLEGAQTLPELFRRNGYRTVSIGKVSHTPDGRVFAYDGSGDGRDELPHAWDELATPVGPWRRGWGAFFAYAEGAHREDGSGHRDVLEFEVTADDDLPDGLIARAAVAKIEELGARDEPFFLGVGFFKPHLPFVATKGDRTAMDAIEIPPPPHPVPLDDALMLACGSRSGEFYGYDAPWEKTRPLALDATLEARRAYLACVRYVDRQVGRVLDAVDESGLADSTIVVVWGDHGWHLGDAGIWGKHSLLDRSLRSVLMLRAPSVTAPGSRCTSIVETLDLYPTLVELAGLGDTRTAFPLDGVSLTPVLDGSTDSVRDAAASYWGDRATIRTEALRLVARLGDDGWEPLALFDARDPVADVQREEDERVQALLERLDRRR